MKTRFSRFHLGWRVHTSRGQCHSVLVVTDQDIRRCLLSKWWLLANAQRMNEKALLGYA